MEVITPKPIISMILGAVFSWAGEIWVFVALTLAAIVLDYVSGMIAGRATEGLNSKKAVRGLYKKTGILILLVLGLFLDGSINYFLHEEIYYFEIPFSLPIAHVTTIWIIITEAISICENLERAGVPIPGWIMKILRKTERKLNNDNGKENKDEQSNSD